ncbi:MAG: hypothetical protein L0287_35480 [Anaerolineae bacterium]|nr:hypothetical protein [Anaerolineae bacterium]MCI0707598.1 hypothetical protein [Ignavibacteriota bacterium]
MILTFGILSVLLFGPFLGIPAWVMGNSDLKKIRAGLIAASAKGLTQGGMILGIVGTFFGVFTIIIIGIAIAVGLSMFSAQSISWNKDGMINELNNLCANAYQYRTLPASEGGGAGSYLGYEIPEEMAETENGVYRVTVALKDTIRFTGVSKLDELNTITVYIDETGRRREWTYTGYFE